MDKNTQKALHNDANFAYLSARLAASESACLTADRLKRLCGVSHEEALAAVREAYGAPDDMPQEQMLSRELEKTFSFAVSLIDGTPDLFTKPYEVLFPLRYVYDCHNLKSAVKCDALGNIAACESMLVSCGTVSREKVIPLVLDRDFSAFPAHMAKAASDAAGELAASHDPQCVDLLLDRAAFADMTDGAEATGLTYLENLVARRIDTVNLLSCVRCIRRRQDKNTFKNVFIPGGTLTGEFFLSVYAENTSKLLTALAHTSFSSLAAGDLSDAEKQCEELYLSYAAGGVTGAFGIEKVISYVVRREAEIKNVRILLSGKAAGLDESAVRARLRGLS